jgi:hypothetical protein
MNKPTKVPAPSNTWLTSFKDKDTKVQSLPDDKTRQTFNKRQLKLYESGSIDRTKGIKVKR